MENAKKSLTLSELRNEKNKYELLINIDLKNIDLNCDIHKKARSFIYSVIVIGIFFCWCSSAQDSSNMYMVLKEKFPEYNPDTVILIILSQILVIPIIFHAISANRITKKIKIQSLLFKSKQNEIFKAFVVEKLHEKEVDFSENISNNFKIIKSDIGEIRFQENEFEKYINKHLQEYKYNFPIAFETNYTKLILLTQCLEEILIQEEYNYNSRYALIIKDNLQML